MKKMSTVKNIAIKIKRQFKGSLRERVDVANSELM